MYHQIKIKKRNKKRKTKQKHNTAFSSATLIFMISCHFLAGPTVPCGFDVLFGLSLLFRSKELLALHLYVYLQRPRAGVLLWMVVLMSSLLPLTHLGYLYPSLESPASLEMAVIPICLHVVSICAQGANVSSSGACSQNGNKKERAVVACPCTVTNPL